LLTKDSQSIREVENIVAEEDKREEARSMFAKTYKIDKELYHVSLVLKENDKEK